MPAPPFNGVYVTATGAFYPGEPVDNDQIDDYVAPLNGGSSRLKRRILAENGIKQRYYSTGPSGETRFSAARMAAEAVRACLGGAGITSEQVDMLCTGTSGGDASLPGFANMVQGELSAPPMTTSSHSGVCAAGLAALSHAAMALDARRAARAVVATSDAPSRLFKRSRFASRGYNIDFEAHFLRWMLSDAAGAWLLETRPRGALSLKLIAVHLRSFSGDYPVCMQVGLAADSRQSYLDYESFAAAEADGAYALRQNIRLLPHLFDLGIHEYVRLAKAGWLDPRRVDHFLCHYSSERFAPVVRDLLDKAGLTIPPEHWYSNLTTRGNTGAASIFVMLDDFLRDRAVKPGERILCFVPESGRFTVGYVLFEAVDPADAMAADAMSAAVGMSAPIGTSAPIAVPEPVGIAPVPPPHDPDTAADPLVRTLLRELASVWHDYRSRAWRAPIVARITRAEVTHDDLVRWMGDWIPQVQQGSIWMRKAVAGLDDRHAALRELVTAHANDEQYDFRILFEDYRRAGGPVARIEDLRRNAGGEALNAYLHARAERPNAIGLLGAIYIIEGTGRRIVPALLPELRRQLALPLEAVRFLHYHGENDVNHLERWLRCAEHVLRVGGQAAVDDIVATARDTAQLYLMQLEAVG